MEWISVEDRLPDTIGSYLIYRKNKEYNTIAWAFFNSDKMWAADNNFYEGVTHWMPLPEPPKEK